MCESSNKRRLIEENGIEILIYLLRTSNDKIREACAWSIRFFVHGCGDERIVRSCANAIPFLVKMLSFSETDSAKEAATWAICSLACDITLCMLIIDSGALGPLYNLLKSGTESCREAAAWTFQNIGPTELRKEGYSLPLLRETGISLSVLAAQRRIDGINISTMALDGFTYHELQEAGYNLIELLNNSSLTIKEIEDILYTIEILSQSQLNLNEMLENQILFTLFHILQNHGNYSEVVFIKIFNIYLHLLANTQQNEKYIFESLQIGFINQFIHLFNQSNKTKDFYIPIIKILNIILMNKLFKFIVISNQQMLINIILDKLYNYLSSCSIENYSLHITFYPAVMIYFLTKLIQHSEMSVKKSLGSDLKLCKTLRNLLKYTKVDCNLPEIPSNQVKYYKEYEKFIDSNNSFDTITCPLSCCYLIHYIVCDTNSRDIYGEYEFIPLLKKYLKSYNLIYIHMSLIAYRSILWYHNYNTLIFIDNNGIAEIMKIIVYGYNEIKIECLWIINNLINDVSIMNHFISVNLIEKLFQFITLPNELICEIILIILNHFLKENIRWYERESCHGTSTTNNSHHNHNGVGQELRFSTLFVNETNDDFDGQLDTNLECDSISVDQIVSNELLMELNEIVYFDRIEIIINIFKNKNNQKLQFLCGSILTNIIKKNDMIKYLLHKKFKINKNVICTKMCICEAGKDEEEKSLL